MQTFQSKRAQIASLRAAIPELAMKMGISHHLTFTMAPTTPRAILEDRIGEWVVRVNRRFLGRNWYAEANRDRRLKGLIFFEQGRATSNHHAHALIRPPDRAEWLNFEAWAPYAFGGTNDVGLVKLPQPLAPGGELHIQRIRETITDLERVVSYDTKEMEHRPSAYEDWSFIDNLTRTGRR